MKNNRSETVYHVGKCSLRPFTSNLVWLDLFPSRDNHSYFPLYPRRNSVKTGRNHRVSTFLKCYQTPTVEGKGNQKEMIKVHLSDLKSRVRYPHDNEVNIQKPILKPNSFHFQDGHL